jgi:diguanylate cyclase (GGDEF)-like protein/PAS domain S-box-containing protein
MGDLLLTESVDASATPGAVPAAAALAVLDCVPAAALLLDDQDRIAFANAQVVHRFGYAKAELHGQNIARLIRDGLGSTRLWLAAQAPTTRARLGAYHKDGTRLTCDTSLSTLDIEGRHFTLCVLHEMLPLAAADESTVTRFRLNEAQRIARIGSWTWDIAADEHWWSDELFRMLDLAPDSSVRPFDRFRELVHPHDRKRLDTGSAQARSGGTARPIDVRVILPGNRERVFEVQGEVTLDTAGNPVRMHGTLQDVTEHRVTQTALQLTETRYREAQRLAKIGNWEWNLATNTSWWSDELYDILEEDRATFPSTFESFLSKVHPDDRQTLIEGQSRAPVGGAAFESTVSRVVLADGREKIVEQIVEVRLDDAGQPAAVVGSIHDITERRVLEDRLRESEARYASTVELAAVGIAHIDPSGRFAWSNQRLRDMLGYTAEELATRSIQDISHGDDLHVTDADRILLHAGKIESLKAEKRYVRRDGSIVWVHITSALRRAHDGTPLYDISIVEDITARKCAEERVQYLATHDELTGLPNRALFTELLDNAITDALKTDRLCALLFIDLDRFKIVNDSLGHEAGDTLLKEVTGRLVHCVRDAGVVSRLGGDEFVVLLRGISDAAAATELAKRILSSVLAPVRIMGHECRVTASIGIAAYPTHARDAPTLMKHADVAMYVAKEEGKNNYKVYTSDTTPMSVERLALEAHLARALERKEFALQYQPKVDVSTGEIKGAEALLRWWNMELGTVTPAQFIPLAEDTGLIVPIGKWVLKSACEQNVAWQRRGLAPIVMSVNLSPRQFKDPALIDDIAAALAETGMAPELLELEITESMIMHNVDQAAEKAAAIKNLGVRLAIDDFGTGYSSLSQLKRFPIDTLKVDRSFIRDIPENGDDRAITEAIISLGKALGVSVVAEGVETAAQHAFLREQACEEMQGFLFSRPCHPDAFTELLQANKQR